jgi:hypothetical protein
VPEKFRISSALKTLDVIDVIFRARMTEVVWDSQISAVLCARLCGMLDMGAAFFAFQGTMGALKYFLDGQYFAPSN